MKGCVLGGGPAGIFISKYLAESGIFIDLFEKEGKLLGNYNFAKERIDILRNLNNERKIKIHLNSDENCINENEYDFYVLATGAIQREIKDFKGNKSIINAIDLINRIYSEKLNKNRKYDNDEIEVVEIGNCNDSNKATSKILSDNFITEPVDKMFKDKKVSFDSNKATSEILSDNLITESVDKMFKDKKVLIIGLGNVSLDLISYISGFVKEITVLCRSSVLKGSFDNHVFRDLIDSKAFEIKINQKYAKEMFNEKELERKDLRRIEMVKGLADLKSSLPMNLVENFLKMMRSFLNIKRNKPKLNLVFGANLLEIDKNSVKYRAGSKILKETFDYAVNSTGFVPNRVDLNTSKPVYHVGWCNQPRGNLGTAMLDARNVANKIIYK